MAGLLRRPAAERTAPNQTEALSNAAHRALVDLLPSEAARFDDLLTELGYDPAAAATADAGSPSAVGTLCAQAVIEFRHGDGANQLGDLHPGAYSDYTGYQPVNAPEPAAVVDPNRWQPLRVSNGAGGYVTQTYVGPHWGLVTPFALASGSQFRPSGPQTTPFGSGPFPAAGFVAQAEQILAYSAGLTDTQQVIAEYWKDGRHSEQPAGHVCLFAQYVSAPDAHGLADDVRVFFAHTNDLRVAGIVKLRRAVGVSEIAREEIRRADASDRSGNGRADADRRDQRGRIVDAEPDRAPVGGIRHLRDSRTLQKCSRCLDRRQNHLYSQVEVIALTRGGM